MIKLDLESHFRTAHVFVYSCKAEQLKALLPDNLSLDTFGSSNGYLAVTFVDSLDLRPKGWSKKFGLSFEMVEYLIFVRIKRLMTERWLDFS